MMQLAACVSAQCEHFHLEPYLKAELPQADDLHLAR